MSAFTRHKFHFVKKNEKLNILFDMQLLKETDCVTEKDSRSTFNDILNRILKVYEANYVTQARFHIVAINSIR